MSMIRKEDFDYIQESPDTRTRTLEARDHTENLYSSCCLGTSDKRLVILLTQVAVSVLILSFSGVMLTISDDPTDKAIYMSLLSSTLSYWLSKNDDIGKK